MRFFVAEDGTYYPVSSIQSFTARYTPSSKREITAIVGKDGHSVNVQPHEADNIFTAGDTIIPAAPGFFYMGLVLDGGPKTTWCRPVIAWLVPSDSYPTPITANGARDNVENDFVIVQPDGMVIDQAIQDYPDVRTCAIEKGFNDEEAIEAVNEWRRALRQPR